MVFIFRYTEAEAAFKRTAQIPDDEPMALSDRLNVHKGVVEHMVTCFTAESDPQVYVTGFEKLATWVDNSLDMCRVSKQCVPC